MTAPYGPALQGIEGLDDLFDRIGWQIDSLMSLDTIGRGVVPVLYRAAVELVGAPLALTAARQLRSAVAEGDVVGIITGFPSRSFLRRGITETDGPVGALYLARVLEEILHAAPIIITDSALRKYVEAPAPAAGLLAVDAERAIAAKRGEPRAAAVGFLDCPVEAGPAEDVARRFLDEIEPQALIAVEMPSLAADGFGYTASGRRIEHEYLAKADPFFHLAGERGVLRLGLGDGGNEMGLARLKDALAGVSPVGARIAATTESEVPVIGGSSNWAAYAVGVCLEALEGRTAVNRRIDLAAIIRLCAEAGAIDGLSSRPEAKVDGTPIELNTSVTALMVWIVERALAEAGVSAHPR